MKIDLHIHTKKISKGDPETRNIISIENFKDNLINSGVKIAAITNHGIFDEEQFNDLKDENYILLPGVELNVKIGDKKVHANVISPLEEINELKTLLNEINNSSGNPIKYSDFISKFNKKKWIIYLDGKNSSNTSWTDEQKRETTEKMNNSLVLIDTNKSTSLMYLNANDFNALIGSDNIDWENYKDNSKKLLDTNLNIESYNVFWNILKTQDFDLKEIFKYNSKKKIDEIITHCIPNEKEYKIKDLTLYQGINIIFGAKRTGKSKILEEINKKNQSDSSYYSSSNKDLTIEKMKNELLEKNKEHFQETRNQLNYKVNSISEYSESKFINFNEFYFALSNLGKISFHSKIKRQHLDPETISKNKEKNNNIQKFLENIKKSNQFLNEIKISSFEEWKEINIVVLREIWTIKKELYKNYWKDNFNEKILKNIKDLLALNRGIKTKPNSIGLQKRFEEKVIFLNKLNDLRNFILISKNGNTKKLKEYKIPGRKEICASLKIELINFFDENNYSWYKQITKLSELRKKLISVIKDKKFAVDFIEIKNNFTNYINDKKSELSNLMVEIADNEGNNEFSNGEKSHLVLEECLSQDDKKYFILDEPAVFLSRESITDFLIPELSKLKKKNKTIIIATHNSSLGINTVPINYIYRKYSNGEDECKTYVGSIWKNEFININNEKDKLLFKEEIINSFEGSMRHFNFRKEIYGKK